MTEQFRYGVLDASHAERWQALRLEGARDFPLGFLVTEDEVKQIGLERIRSILDAGGARGVFSDRTLVGFCGYRPQQLKRTRHRAELGPFFVTSDYHGSGAARCLMLGVIEEARSNGIEQLELFVDTLNGRAIAFYERMGFKRIATHTDGVRFDGESHNDHFYILRLTE